jgi:hypothetical protein
MEYSEKYEEEYFVNIIQKTPHMEELAKKLEEHGFPPFNVVSDKNAYYESLVIFHQL